MIVVSPARAEERMVLKTDSLAEVVEAVGTPAYPRACFRVLAESFDVDHWALFRYGASDSVRCLATASRAYERAAEHNIDDFVSRCHRFDPALGVVSATFARPSLPHEDGDRRHFRSPVSPLLRSDARRGAPELFRERARRRAPALHLPRLADAELLRGGDAALHVARAPPHRHGRQARLARCGGASAAAARMWSTSSDGSKACRLA